MISIINIKNSINLKKYMKKNKLKKLKNNNCNEKRKIN